MTVVCSHVGQLGRLGNQLWQIASTIGIAARTGEDVQFPPWDYEPYFSVPSEFFVENPQGVEAHTLALSLHPDERPYLQDYSLFADVEDLVRSYFEPSERTREELYDEYPWFYEPDHMIALHVRRITIRLFQ